MSLKQQKTYLYLIIATIFVVGVAMVVAMVEAPNYWYCAGAFVFGLLLLRGLSLMIKLVMITGIDVFQRLGLLMQTAECSVFGFFGLVFFLFGEKGIDTILPIVFIATVCWLLFSAIKNRHEIAAEMKKQWLTAKWW